MPQDMWGGQGTTWEGGRMAIWGHWFPPSTIYISLIWTEVISLGSKLLTLRVTSVAPWSLFFCSTLLWHPAFSDRVVAAGTTVMGSKEKVRAVMIELCLPWSAAPAAGCFGVYESKRACFSFYQSGLGSLTKQLHLTLQVTIPKSILCPISSSGAHKGPVSRFNLWPVSLHFP